MAVVIDSDKKAPQSKLNASKRRVIESLQADAETGVAWVTAGYTIENYVPSEILTAAVHDAHPSTRKTTFLPDARYADPLRRDRIGLRPSKSAIARCAVHLWEEDDWPLDLKERVGDVIALIERANSHM